MEVVVTPQPHLIPGYTGHCPAHRFRIGKTYGKATHKTLLSPCVNHAPELIVEPPSEPKSGLDNPTLADIDRIRNREYFVDAAYRHPIIPGYDGFIPNQAKYVGKRFLAAATSGLVEHENLMDLMRCERRNLVHGDILQSGRGRFQPKLGERLIPTTKYHSPLLPVRKREKGMYWEECPYKEKKISYSKFTVPHFMEKDDEEKYIVNGYGGHVPMAMTRFGQSNKRLTNSALCEFTNNYHHRLSSEWCSIENAGVGTECPGSGNIYLRTVGIIPHYGGHVPGELFTFGLTYGNSTIDAKRWMELHKDKI